MSKKHVILDATMLSSLMSCPRYMDLRFNRLLVPVAGKSNSLEAGSLAHHILEHFYKSIRDGKMRADAIQAGFDAGSEYINGFAVDNKYLKDPDIEIPQNLPPESMKIGNTEMIGYKFVFDRMNAYFDLHRLDTFTPIAVEEVRGKIIYEDDDIVVLWKAKFDLIADFANGVIPVDHKTAKQNRKPMSLNNQFIGQCLITGSRNIIINQIGFQKSLPIEECIKRVTISYTADKIAEWVNDIVPYYARMYAAYTEAGTFPPNFTHCENKYGWCMYKDPCEMDRNTREEVYKLSFKVGKHWDVVND